MADPRHPRHCEESFKRRIVRLCENGKPAREIRPVELCKRNGQLEMEVDVSEQAAPVFARR